MLLKSSPKLITTLSCVCAHPSHYVNEIAGALLEANLENQFPALNRLNCFGGVYFPYNGPSRSYAAGFGSAGELSISPSRQGWVFLPQSEKITLISHRFDCSSLKS